MFLKLLVLMTVLPAVELYLLIQLGSWMGAAETVLLILVTGVVGAALAKREGLSVLARIQEESKKGIPPAGQLLQGLLVLIGGVLLLTPGVLTDAFGFALIAPPTRALLAPLVGKWLASKVSIMPNLNIGAPRPGPAARPPQRDPDPPRFDHPTL